MNFDYIQKAETETEELKNLYADLYENLEKAEGLYWSEPQKCAALLRNAAEKICHIYNSHYKIGFPQTALLEEYLCYTDNDAHNVMVSRFLSVARMEQRDRLEWLRVWGNECVFIGEDSEEALKNPDKLYINVRKMMLNILAASKEMCEKINHMQGLEERVFEEDILPGYLTEEERAWNEKQLRKENRKSRFQIFKKR